jgi:hypothetical protein
MTKLTAVLFVMLIAGALNYGTASADDSLSNRQLGGYRPANVNAADVVRIADFATSVISASSNSGPVKRIRIVRAWKQVVAGTNYKLILELLNKYTGKVVGCQAIVFDQPWTNTLELTSSSCFPKRERRNVPGGYVTRNVNDPDVKEMAKFASSIITANTHPRIALIRILKAESQVVAGTNYRMTLLFASGPYSRYLLRCGVIVFDQPWTNTRELTESKCRWIRRSGVNVETY